MTNLPSLANAEWLTAPAVRQIFGVLEAGGEEARVIGGAVRNALMGGPVRDIDFGTTAAPAKVTGLAEAAGIKVVPTGIDHGTVTLVIAGHGYEVTTLREDIETDGRHAVVRFGRDWETDARRRDFTVNALSVDSSGTVYDPVDGYPDIVARRIRFIGDAATRIAEDRLRILRLFRFHAEYATGDIDPAALSAAIRGRLGLRDLSAERIGQEMRKIVVAPRSVEIATLMQETGVLPVVFGSVAYLAPFGKTVRASTAAKAEVSVGTRLAALGCRVAEDALRITDRLRLSNAERDRMLAALAAADALMPYPDETTARRLLYQLKEQAFRDGVFQAFAWSREPPGPSWKELYHLPDRWKAPAFPLGGRDVVANGVDGPAVGAMLRDVETWWIDQDFAPDEPALRARLQQMIAAQQ